MPRVIVCQWLLFFFLSYFPDWLRVDYCFGISYPQCLFTIINKSQCVCRSKVSNNLISSIYSCIQSGRRAVRSNQICPNLCLNSRFLYVLVNSVVCLTDSISSIKALRHWLNTYFLFVSFLGLISLNFSWNLVCSFVFPLIDMPEKLNWNVRQNHIETICMVFLFLFKWNEAIPFGVKTACVLKCYANWKCFFLLVFVDFQCFRYDQNGRIYG